MFLENDLIGHLQSRVDYVSSVDDVYVSGVGLICHLVFRVEWIVDCQ